ncbi:MAG: arginine deiminase [Synergistaceae bacterium]|nr:arginine deiminase [Synergistaceae bacterium]
MEEKERSFYVASEVGKLKRVMLHRPGRELERLTIDNKDELLFDDILWVEEAQKEHDAFADLLRDNGAEVVYFRNSFSQVLREEEIRSNVLDDTLAFEALDIPLGQALKKELMDFPPSDLADALISGLTKEEATSFLGNCRSLVLDVTGSNDFLIRPLPNLYFQRDPHVFVKDGVIISVMNFQARRREPLYARYIYENHPYFKGLKILFGDDKNDAIPYAVEGGDVLVLSEDVVAIGISQRTTAGAVQILGRRLAQRVGIKTVLAVDIPKERSYMHLDTVFTMVDRDAFTIFPGVSKAIRIWKLAYDDDGELLSLEENDDIDATFREALHLETIRFIETGGGDPVSAARDQWNDGTNTLSIAPGNVVTYRRNVVSNRVLRENGIKVLEVRGAELGRGRGGPRCMSMPLLRDH